MRLASRMWVRREERITLTRADIILAAQIPMDVMWLDIEYSKQHMYMIWDEVTFPDPERMIQGLDDEGRKVS